MATLAAALHPSNASPTPRAGASTRGAAPHAGKASMAARRLPRGNRAGGACRGRELLPSVHPASPKRERRYCRWSSVCAERVHRPELLVPRMRGRSRAIRLTGRPPKARSVTMVIGPLPAAALVASVYASPPPLPALVPASCARLPAVRGAPSTEGSSSGGARSTAGTRTQTPYGG